MKDKNTALIGAIFFVLGLFLEGAYIWFEFIEDFHQMPFNQGLETGLISSGLEFYNQCPDFNVEETGEAYRKFYKQTIDEHGLYSQRCWLALTGSYTDIDGKYGRNSPDCKQYYEEMEKI